MCRAVSQEYDFFFLLPKLNQSIERFWKWQVVKEVSGFESSEKDPNMKHKGKKVEDIKGEL